MTSPGQQTSSNAAPSGNGQSSLHDLFAMTDEQILEIEPETQDAQAHSAADAADRALSTQGDFPEEIAVPASRTDRDGNAEPEASSELYRSAHDAAQSTSHQSPVTSHPSSEPPTWLAERMADPQAGAEARELWNGVEQSRQEAAAFREVFAKPEDARAAAQRSRLLDDIDRAYFAGDSSQRAQLAASMLREDPAAFREMVFAGLRALEETGKSGATNNFAQRSPNTIGAGLVYAEPRSAPPADARAADPRVEAQHAAPPSGDTLAADAHLAALRRLRASRERRLGAHRRKRHRAHARPSLAPRQSRRKRRDAQSSRRDGSPGHREGAARRPPARRTSRASLIRAPPGQQRPRPNRPPDWRSCPAARPRHGKTCPW